MDEILLGLFVLVLLWTIETGVHHFVSHFVGGLLG